MKILYFFLLSLVNSKVIINNNNIPVCRNCIHFKPSPVSEFSSIISQCNKFADKDLKTDEIIFNYADNCRSDENKCGKEGKYFEKEPNLQGKIFLHNFLFSVPYAIQISFYVIFICITFRLGETR
jgi:hypothetical protein